MGIYVLTVTLFAAKLPTRIIMHYGGQPCLRVTVSTVVGFKVTRLSITNQPRKHEQRENRT